MMPTSLPRPCCLLHALPAAFAPDRTTCMAHDHEPVSFGDATAREPSSHADRATDATAGLFERPERGQWVMVHGGTVHTMRDRSVLPDHDVLVRDGVIDGVRPSGEAPPDDALIVEAVGKHVLPGFTDIHTHPFLKTWADAWAAFLPDLDTDAIVLPYDLLMFQFLAAGVTRIEVMAGCADMLALRRAIAAGRIHGPRMRIGSPLIDGNPPIQSPFMSWIAGDAAGGHRAAREIAARGFDFAKPYSNLTRDAYTALAEECAALGIRMMGHVTPQLGIEGAIALGQGGIAHAAEYFYNESGPKRRDMALFAHYARITADNGVWVQPTVTVSRMMEVILGKLPLIAPDRHLMHPLIAKLYALDGTFAQSMRDNPAKAHLGDDNFALAVAMTKALHKTGAKLLTGTDACNPFLVDGFSLHEEFANLVEQVGMMPIEVIEASTVAAADYHGEGDRAGRVAPGMVADLVVLDADPTRDIHASRTIDTVLAAGAILRKGAIADGMARIADRFAAMPV